MAKNTNQSDRAMKLNDAELAFELREISALLPDSKFEYAREAARRLVNKNKKAKR